MSGDIVAAANAFVPGTRVRLADESVGTVRYVGEVSDARKKCRCQSMMNLCYVSRVLQVEGHKSTWLGIEWDEPERGKHDGSVQGVGYFSTRYVCVF